MNQRRRNKLPMASFQVRMALPFLVAAFGALLCHVMVLARGVTAASEAAGADAVFAGAVSDAYYGSTVWTLLIAGPLLLAFSVLMTFKVAGPIYRMRRHLEAIAQGNEPPPCNLRTGDELQDFCEAMNRAVARLQAQSQTQSGGAAGVTLAAESSAPSVDRVDPLFADNPSGTERPVHTES